MYKGIVLLDQTSGYLQIDMLYALQRKYPQTAIIAGSIVERDRSLPADTAWTKIMRYDKSTTLKRLVSWTVSTLQMWYHVLTKYRGYKLFIITNPPFAVFIPSFVSNSYSVLVYDVYPDILYTTGYFKKNSWLVRLWERWNKKIFAGATNLYTISQGMKQEVAKYADPDKIEVVPIWTDAAFFKPMARSENRFLTEHQLQDKFIVMYSGNLGNTHDVDVLVDVAAELQENKDIFFVIIGEGGKKKLIQEKISRLKPNNVLLLPWQPAEMLPYTFNAPDIGVVTLGHESSTMSVPSKTYNLMSAGLPILAIASEESELNTLIKQYQIGVCFSGNKQEAIKSFIKKLYQDSDLCKQYAENARRAAADFSPANADRFE